MNVFEQALLNTLMGMGTVFAVLIFISLLISLFVYIPSIERALKNRSSKKEKKAAQEERPGLQSVRFLKKLWKKRNLWMMVNLSQ